MTSMRQSARLFRVPLVFTGAGLAGAVLVGWSYEQSISGALSFLIVASVLAVLEISLSFDNAVVNANTLNRMTPVWQRRFLTWGILIAVFGMRIVFPLAIVSIAAQIGPLSAIYLAAADPAEYARIIEGAHISISAFGGTFLMMVALCFFIDEGKKVDWIRSLECQLRKCASIRGLEIALVLIIILVVSGFLPDGKASEFVFAAILGLLTFLGFEALGHFLGEKANLPGHMARGGVGAFLYLEMLDASFSLDGVIGAFALTNNLFLIAIGLGIGAFYVRSMTIMLVENRTLTEFRFLEHGAFYSIFILSAIMFMQSLMHVPEVFTGLVGASLILFAGWRSIEYRKAEKG
ncbi:DUF475 domain-containing protein [Roseibium sp. SCP14]|uniref:DUF475 domain-containing protein n=1 Tax=Roseibium sp. SCP14 TaxID=3141375 RepID=UPI00333D03F0